MRPVTIAVTGASGAMGKETVKALLTLPNVRLRLLLHEARSSHAYARTFGRAHKGRLAVRFGDIRSSQDLQWLVKDADYVAHIAAVIPPIADHDETLTITTNYDGTCRLVDAVKAAGNRAKFLHISTVALYGNRNEAHPWGRVGDPLLVSAFDVYGTSKLRAERYVLEAGLNRFAVLRQTALLYDNMLTNNISDGLMFHTPWNAPIEWVTAVDSGRLIRNIVAADLDGRADDFWMRVYNIGGGKPARTTGFETIDDGFRLIGLGAKRFFEPHWDMTRNFHCFWFSDSDELEARFHFRSQGCKEFWAWMKKKHGVYALARPIPARLIRKLVIEPLLKNDNAPMYWASHGDDARIAACYYDPKEAAPYPNGWDDVDLLCEREGYEESKETARATYLDHGYDETKPDDALDLDDMKQAAAFRGGTCLSKEMRTGDLFAKLEWTCHNGHTFSAAPYTILKAGHWCPACCAPDREWRFDLLAKRIPFYAQVWYDTHRKDEDVVYEIKNGVASMTKTDRDEG